jgi:hypothetical protein
MNPLDYAKAVTEFWTAQGQGLMAAQQQAGQAVAAGMQAMTAGALPALPGVPSDLAPGAAELSRAGQSLTELWSAATAMAATLAAAVPAPGDAAGGDTTVAATFRKMVDPHTWLGGLGEMDQALARMAEGPRLADLWEVERRHARVLQAWMTVRRRGLEHNAVLLEAWQRAGGRFSEQLAARAGADGPAPDAKAALALWTEIANAELLETQRGDPFLQTQTAMIRASTELQLAQHELVEHFGKQYGFPTRTELDDLARSVTELRRDLRTLRRTQQHPAAPPTPAPAPPPKPRTAPPRRAAIQLTAKKKGKH